ncbi:MAG: hypothetical protein JO281_04110 [Pseudonocardiales bacterium]|nr:hypothetical protein [Pseudonocardiales bacterium]
MSEQTESKPPYPREPQAYPGGEQEPGGPVPPYEGRQTTGKDPDQLLEERGGVPSHETGPRDVSQAEREGMTDTDMSPSGPHGVGERTSSSGEDFGRSMSEEGHRDDRLDTGVGDEEQITGPAMHPGDQGG